MVSKASEDLPEPDSPVITISRSRGSSRSRFLRLCVRAPRMRIVSMGLGDCAAKGRYYTNRFDMWPRGLFQNRQLQTPRDCPAGKAGLYFPVPFGPTGRSAAPE